MSYFNAPISVPYDNPLRLLDLTNQSYLSLRTTPVVASNIAFTFPSDYGLNGYALTTDGTGNLTWQPAGIASVSSNIIVESSSGDIKFSTLSGSANIHTDNANIIELSVGTNEIIHHGSNLTINMTTDSTNSTDGALVIAGGIGVGKDIHVGGNIAVGSRIISTINNFIESSSLQELWSGSNTASMKQLIISVGWTSNFTCQVAQPTGTHMDIFFTGNAAGAGANIDFGANQVYIGSGVARYLVFNSKGQSASLVYIDNVDGALSGWRVINTGAQVY